MVVKVFSKKECPKCEAAKDFASLTKEKGFAVEMYDIETVDGLSEAAMYSIMATPSVVLTDDLGKMVQKWKGGIPQMEELLVIGRNA